MSPEQEQQTQQPADFNEITISQPKNELVSDYNSGSFRHFDNINCLLKQAILKSFEDNRYFKVEIECRNTKNGNKKIKQIVRAVIKNVYETLHECHFDQSLELQYMPTERIDTLKMNFTPVEICVKDIKTGEENRRFLWD